MARYEAILDIDEEAVMNLAQMEEHTQGLSLFEMLNLMFLQISPKEEVKLHYLLPPGRPAKDGVDRDLLFLKEQAEIHSKAKCECHMRKECVCYEDDVPFPGTLAVLGIHCTLYFEIDCEIDDLEKHRRNEQRREERSRK